MSKEKTKIVVPSRLCTKDGRKFSNGFLHSSTKEDDITMYHVETDFGNQITVSRDELLNLWRLMLDDLPKITYEDWSCARNKNVSLDI